MIYEKVHSKILASINLFFWIFFQLMSLNANSADIRYSAVSSTPMVKFSIPWSFGIHEGSSRTLSGSVTTDDSDKVLNANFEIPISSMTTGNSTRDCHMREALGLNYEISTFPEEHVCNRKNQIPESGPDSIQYPVIAVELQDMTFPKDVFAIGIPQSVGARIKVSMHGVTKTIVIDKILVTKKILASGSVGFNVISTFQLSLKDFSVQVKPVNLGFKSVGVEDQVTVQLAIDLVRQ